MWKKYIEIIKNNIQENCSVKEYCEKYIFIFPEYKILSIKETQNLINYSNGDLFLTELNITNLINSGDVSQTISFIYHFFNLNYSESLYEPTINNDEFLNYKNLFNYESPKFIYKYFNFEPDTLLSIDSEDNILSYLFFYYLPCIKKNSLLYHHIENKPLITFNKITENSFDMLLYLMENFESENFNNLCQNYNLNLLLLENFMDTATDLYAFHPDKSLDFFLPMNKIHKLLSKGCTFRSFTALREKKLYYTYPNLSETLNYIEKKYLYDKISSKLKIKKHLNHKIIKI